MIMARKSRFTDIKVHVHVHIWGLPPQFRSKHKFFYVPMTFFPCIIKSSIFIPHLFPYTHFSPRPSSCLHHFVSFNVFIVFHKKKEYLPSSSSSCIFFLLHSIQFLLLRRLPYLRRRHACCFFLTVVKGIPCMPRNCIINISISNFKSRKLCVLLPRVLLSLFVLWMLVWNHYFNYKVNKFI